MDVASFDDIRSDFDARVSRIVWCTMTTVDRKGRPRSRVVHPIWDGPVGYLLTGPNSLKAKHVKKNPYVSFSYWDPQHQQAYIDCSTEWITDAGEKQRIWDFFKNTPLPYGYDPAMFWPGGLQDPGFGVMKLMPWRVELCALGDMMTGAPPKVWRS